MVPAATQRMTYLVNQHLLAIGFGHFLINLDLGRLPAVIGPRHAIAVKVGIPANSMLRVERTYVQV